MGVLTITLKNASEADKQFFIFADKPKVNGSGEGVFSNVFLSDFIAAGSTTSFKFVRDVYAVCGKKKLQNGATVSQSGYKGPVTLGTNVVPGTTYRMVVNHDAPKFQPNEETPSAPVGAFDILTGIDFNQGGDIWIGIGNRQDDDSPVVPTASIQASPNATFDIIPHLIYYCATGNYQAGVIFDARSVGVTKEIDFSGGHTESTVTYNNNGTWSG